MRLANLCKLASHPGDIGRSAEGPCGVAVTLSQAGWHLVLEFATLIIASFFQNLSFPVGLPKVRPSAIGLVLGSTKRCRMGSRQCQSRAKIRRFSAGWRQFLPLTLLAMAR